MATQTVEFRSPPSQTITAKLFAVGSDTQIASETATEATNRKGTYSAAYTNVPAGEYELIALVSTTPVARWFVTLTLTTATFQVYDKSQTVLMTAGAVAEIQNALGANSIGTVTRATDDQTPLSFVWPVTGAATALGTNSLVSIDDGATFAAITGAITELGLIDGKYWYQIAFNGADRPAAQGVSWFRILDGTYTKFFNLTIPSTAIEATSQSILTDTDELQQNQGNWITATGFSTHAAADVWTVGARTVTGGTITTLTGHTAQTGDSFARIGATGSGLTSLATQTSVNTTNDRLGFTLAALAGNCADPQTAAETYSIILGVDTYTIDHTGLDATGTRTTATLTKS